MLAYLRRSMRLQYGWWLVALGVVVLTLTGDGLISAFLATWESNDFWGAAPLSWLVSSVIGGTQILLPLIGLAVDRFGARTMMLCGLPLCALTAMSAAFQPSPSVAAALFTVLVMATLAGTNAPTLKAINDWFDHQKPLAIAVLLAAVDLLRFPVSLAGSGGRASLLVFGVLILVVGLPLATQVRRPPQPIDQPMSDDLPTEGESSPSGSPRTTTEFGWLEAVRSREFWMLTIAAASLGAVDQLTRTMLFPIAAHRYGMEGSYQLFETPFGIVSTLFVLVGSLMGTRMALRRALLIFGCVHVVAVVTILIAPTLTWLFVATVMLDAGHGGARALGIAAVGEYFGKNRFATLSGTLSLMAHFLGLAYAGAPLWLANLSDDPTWALSIMLIPAAVGVGAYRVLGDPKPPPTQVVPNGTG